MSKIGNLLSIYIAYEPLDVIRWDKPRPKTMSVPIGHRAEIIRTLNRMPGYIAYLYSTKSDKRAFEIIMFDAEEGNYIGVSNDTSITVSVFSKNGKRLGTMIRTKYCKDIFMTSKQIRTQEKKRMRQEKKCRK